jgi:hypothetical protein
MTNRGSLVRWDYFKEAIARSTAAALDILEEASNRGVYMGEDSTAIKGLPFNRWIQEDEGEKLEDSIKWGWGKIRLASEDARLFWLECLGEYKDLDGSVPKTGVSNPAAEDFDIDRRVRYLIKVPELVFDGLTPGGSEADNSGRLMRAIKVMSKGTLNPTGIVRMTAVNVVPWVHMSVRASISWDRAAQVLEYEVKGVLGDISVKRLKSGKTNPIAVAEGAMDIDIKGKVPPVTPTSSSIPKESLLQNSPEMERGKLDIMYDEASNIHDSLNRSVAKGNTNRRLDDKMKAAEKSKTNLMAAGLNKIMSKAQRTRVAEMAIWMEEAKNTAKGVKKARND